MDAVRKDVELLVQKELESANKKFPLFRSKHEGCAVIIEEIQETKQELKEVKKTFEATWDFTKEDLYREAILSKLKRNAVSMAVEAIQVAAMAQKFIDSERKNKGEEYGNGGARV